jgi:phenylpropionate dioxygenase-like ring-hydroxylating dioxygenase large terminal subunit
VTGEWNRELEDVTRRLLDHHRHHTTDVAAEIYSIDVNQYIDSERFNREVAMLFRGTPLLLALSAELPDPGNFKKLDVAGVPVMLVRGRDHCVNSYLNVCRHRGSPIVTDDRGTTRRFICPYHAWSYNLDGSLARIPAPDTFGDFDRAKFGLVPLPVVERDGVIWGGTTVGQSLDLDAHLGELGPELAKMDLGSLHHGASRRLRSSNWKLAMDTYLENYHIAFLHATTLYRASGTTNISAVDMYGAHQRMASPRKLIAELSHEDIPNRNQFDYFSLNYTIFPNSVLLFTPEAIMVAQIFPGATVDESVTVLEHFSRRPRATPEEEKAFDARVDLLSDAVENEDYWMQNLVQGGLRSGANSVLTFGRNELLLHHFHAEIDDRVGAVNC